MSLNLLGPDDWIVLRDPDVDVSHVESVNFNAESASWSVFELLFAKCSNIRDLSIHNLSVIDSARDLPSEVVDSLAIERLDVSFDSTVAIALHTTIEALWKMSDVRHIDDITLRLGHVDPGIDHHEELVRELMKFLMRACPDPTVLLRSEISISDGAVHILVVVAYPEHNGTETNLHRTIHLFDPNSDSDSELTAALLDLARDCIAFGLREEVEWSENGTDSVDLHPLWQAKEMRFPLSVVPSMWTNGAAVLTCFPCLKRLHIDWDVAADTVSRNIEEPGTENVS
ncbi:hypothetical protein EXIGLDRAFT_751702 [Exidia glandulosa HHB12029]|uniref:Uncharacterized protein n=1 Tax=Exidia glandulosa HHB12029 TaxID=1314781 RepID=A0A165F664_EXIGL|nr:hypothetical protein EXIGLDRAFT_751702 [Exidia glandulosa HHB12029]